MPRSDLANAIVQFAVNNTDFYAQTIKPRAALTTKALAAHAPLNRLLATWRVAANFASFWYLKEYGVNADFGTRETVACLLLNRYTRR